MRAKIRVRFDLSSPLSRVFLVAGMIFCLASCGSPPPNSSQAEGGWLARTGERVVTVQEFQNYFDLQCRRNPKLPKTPAQKKKLLESYLEKEVLLQEASRLDLDQDPEVRTELQEARQQILLKHLFDHQAIEFEKQIAIGADEIKRYYEELCQEIRFRYFPVDDPTKASDIIAKWNNSEIPPEALDSGMVRLASLSEEWKEQIGQLAVMKPKLVTIGSEWFVILLVSQGEAPEKPLHEYRDRIVKELRDRKKQEMMQNWIAGLKTKKPIEINQTYPWP